MNLSISKLLFIAAAVCFLLSLLTVTLGALNLVTLGLFFLALGMVF